MENVLMMEGKVMEGWTLKKIYIQIELLLYIDLGDWRATYTQSVGWWESLFSRYEILSNLFSGDNVSCSRNTLLWMTSPLHCRTMFISRII